MKRQTAVPVFLVTALLAGLLAVRFWYDSKCVKFQDENMEMQTLYLLDSGRGSVLKKELEQIESFYVTKTSGRFATLEDLKQFPNLERVSLSYDVNSMTDEEWEEFQKYRGGIPAMLAETLPELPKLKQLDLTFFDHFENLDFLSECDQVEELWIFGNTIKDIEGLRGMTSLRFLILSSNPFTDISPLQDLKNLEALDLHQVPVENLEILTGIDSLKLLVYEPADQKEEEILQRLEQQGVTVYREYTVDMQYLLQSISDEEVRE